SKVSALRMDSPSVGLISATGAQRLRSRLTLLSRFAPRAGLVILRQTFVRRCQNCVARASIPVGLVAFACFDLGDGGLEQPGALGVGEHGVDDAMLAGIELARTKIAAHADTHALRTSHVKRWSPLEGRIRFYRVAVAINPHMIVRAVMLPRQAKKRCAVVVNRDLDIGEGGDGHEAKQLDAPLAGAAVDRAGGGAPNFLSFTSPFLAA